MYIRMRKTLGIIIGIAIAASSGVQHVHAQSAGLVDGIWFSRDPVTDFGDVDVYAVVHNQTPQQLLGIATLLVDGAAVGAQEVRVGAGDIMRVRIPYAFTAGSHEVRVSFTAGSGTNVRVTELDSRRVLVVRDTDGDGIQNTTDSDDDNDGIPDSEDPDPLVKNAARTSNVSLSETGQALLARLTGRSTDDSNAATADPESTTTRGFIPDPVVATFGAIEEARKKGATVMREREQVRRAALAQMERADETSPAVEGFTSPLTRESKKREHQIAAAGAATLGAMLERSWLFYLELIVLTLGIAHLVVVWFRRRFNRIDDE